MSVIAYPATRRASASSNPTSEPEEAREALTIEA
jgi:hypothetical protein